MKYTREVIIDLPRQEVVALFDNPDNLSQWQPGLKSFETISGEAGQPGAKSKLVFDMNGRVMEMIETVQTHNLPEEISVTYETKGVHNNMVNRFYEAGDGKTRWVTENEFQFSGFMRLIGFFMRGAFPKQTMKNMNDFKKFAESQ